MADSIIGLTDVSATGAATKKLDTDSLTVGANTVERQRVRLAGAGATDLSVVKAASTAAAAADPALVVAISPNSADIVGAAGTLNASNATASVNAAGMSGVSMALQSGTLIGQIGPEISMDGGTSWSGTYFDDPTTGARVATIVFSSANGAVFQSIATTANATNYRVRVSSFTSGSASCTLRATSVRNQTDLIQAQVTEFYPTLTAGTIAPLNQDRGGFLRTGSFGESDPGHVLGTAWALSYEPSEDFRMRVEIDERVDGDVFNYTAQNTAKHRVDTTTMTVTYANQALNLNGGSITTITTGAAFSTRQYFSIYGSGNHLAYVKIKFTGTPAATNQTTDWGYFSLPTSNPYAPTDGVYFRMTSTGIACCTTNNGVTTASATIVTAFGGAAFAPAAGTDYDSIITINENVAVFWLDTKDGNGYTMVARINPTATAGRPLLALSAPFSVRTAIAGGASSAALQINIIAYSIQQGGLNTNRPWNECQTQQGNAGSQGVSGQTMGSTALYTNNLAAGAGATMTNTTAALGTGLGGQFTALATSLVLATDEIVCSYQNPAPSATLSGRTLIIDSVSLVGVVTTTALGSAVAYAVTVNWGHTAVSLLTAESANTKAPRRKVIGAQALAAAAGSISSGTGTTSVPMTDIAIQPGEFFSVSVKNFLATPASGVVTFLVDVQSHWSN